MRRFVEVRLPSLIQRDLTSTEVDDLLNEIGEDFRRIHYHVFEAQKYYRYLVPYDIADCDEDSR